MKELRTWLAAAVVAAAAVGCGGPTIVRFQGIEPLNLNEKGETTPVEVRIFLLKDGGSFNKAQIEQLWGPKYKEVLGGDVVGEPRQVTIYAGAEKKVDLGPIPAEVRFVGIMGMFGKREEKTERHFAVAKEDADDFLFELTGYTLRKKK